MKQSFTKRMCRHGTPYTGLCRAKEGQPINAIENLQPFRTWRCEECPNFFDTKADDEKGILKSERPIRKIRNR